MKMVLPESFMTWPRRAKGEESIRETIAEHRKSALRLGFRRFVLKHIPMLGELAILEADNVGRDPGHLPSNAGETTVRDDVIALGENELVFIAQRVGRRADEVEQPVAARLDMSAVLDILVGPIVFSRSVVTPVEERVKSFEDERLVLFRRSTSHSTAFQHVGRP